VAALADAGLTAYHAVKKAAPILCPGTSAVVLGAGGLGHIGIQSLKALTAAQVIVVDRSAAALELARTCGADHTVLADGSQTATVKELTDGHGCEAVIDFVGEGGALEDGVGMLRRAGTYYVISSMSGRREWARWLRRSYRLAQVRSARTGWPVAWV
jgi:NAD+-dependent secondary alcohol dehydrogenase Adh1